MTGQGQVTYIRLGPHPAEMAAGRFIGPAQMRLPQI